VAGELTLRAAHGGPAAPGTPPCEPPSPGLGQAIAVEILLRAGSGEAMVHTFEIPAHTAAADLLIDGLAAGNGYRATVTASVDKDPLFTGESDVFAVLPGSSTTVAVPLLPVGRAAVLAAGKATPAGDEMIVPVQAANSLPVRAIEFDLCYDPAVLAPVGATAAGPRVAAFRGAGGEPVESGIYRAVLWSEDATALIGPGHDQVLEIRFRFQPGVPAGTATDLVFVSAQVVDEAAAPPFAAYFFDGQVTR
jgi:hypothetical protein